MANFFTRILNGLNLTDDDDYDDDDEEYNTTAGKSEYSEPEDDNKTKAGGLSKRKTDYSYDEGEDYEPPKAAKPKKSYGKVVPMKSIPGGTAGMEVRVIRPITYEDSREICDTLSSGISVVLNLDGLDSALCQKILDFTSGSVYAMNGNLQKVTSRTFIITPNNVPISGNFDEMLDGSIDLSGNTRYVFKD